MKIMQHRTSVQFLKTKRNKELRRVPRNLFTAQKYRKGEKDNNSDIHLISSNCEKSIRCIFAIKTL
jgi:hypothetical protein